MSRLLNMSRTCLCAAAVVSSLVGCNRPPAPQRLAVPPLKEGPPTLADFAAMENLEDPELAGEEFARRVNAHRGERVHWELCVFNSEVMTEGFTDPESGQHVGGEVLNIIFMVPDAVQSLPPNRRILVRCPKGYGTGLDVAEPGELFVVEGTIWGTTGDGWRDFYLKDFTLLRKAAKR